MAGKFRNWLHTFVPSNFNNIFGLAWKLITSGNKAAWFAMYSSFLGVMMTPLDIFLQIFEKRLYKKAPPAQQSQIFVCGAPRSGTTVMGQVLIKNLPVYYFNNLTSIFPRSPITASKMFGWMVRGSKDDITYNSFYGRTEKFSLPNDALYFWDRWAGSDRKQIPTEFSPEAQENIVQFFNAYEAYSGMPVLNKNNALNTYAHLAAEVLDNAYFVCMDRDPVYLAQSHLIARRFIHGSDEVSYGIRGEGVEAASDPIEDICRQVTFHKQRIREEQELIGRDRFIIVPYEDFCADPAAWVQHIADKTLGITLDEEVLRENLPALNVANKQKLDDETFHKIQTTFERLTERP